MDTKNVIRDKLFSLLNEAIGTAKKGYLPVPTKSGQGKGLPYDPNHMVFGRTGLVNRVRGGKLQWRHLVSEVQGFKILDGGLVKMTPQELRNRRIAARIAARKRAGEVAQIVRNRRMSLMKRDMRLDAYSGV
jgi:hypothetical protein